MVSIKQKYFQVLSTTIAYVIVIAQARLDN